MYKNRILVITDNAIQYQRFLELISENKFYDKYTFDFKRSITSKKEKLYEKGIENLELINVKKEWKLIVNEYDLVISLHCKQLFPPELVNNIECINIHPGYNPINRGWYPQVFAINYGNEVGATIHKIDEKLDHGLIITREKCPIYAWDTSLDVYERILELEIKLLKNSLPEILSGNYTTVAPEIEGRLFLRKDFNALCELDLNEKGTFKKFIDRLRALSHGKYKNAYFIDENGNKIYLSISIDKPSSNDD